MENIDIFKNSKARTRSSIQSRTSETNESLKRILIVSEGIKTEPIYFNYLIEHLKLSITDVEVEGSKKSCPLKVAQYAKQLYDTAVKKGNPYDIVYCIIDKDTHPHYQNALSYISTLSKNNFIAINSIPCFELWLLFHYTYTTKPFTKTANKSVCQSLISHELKKYLPNYVKNISTLSAKELEYILKDTSIAQAIKYSKKIALYCKQGNTDNPSTRIHKVVQELQKQKIIKDLLLK